MGLRDGTPPNLVKGSGQATRQELLDEVRRLRERIVELENGGNSHALATEAREEARHHLSDFAKSISGWFWDMDAQLRFTYLSPDVYEITGVSPEWHYGKTREEIGIPESVSIEAWQTHLETLSRHEPFKDFVFQRDGPDGLKWMQTSGTPIYDENGDFQGYCGIASDVTARVAAEGRAERLLAAIENLSEFFVLWDPSDKLVMCNARFREINTQVIDTTKPGTPFQEHICAARPTR